jgi:antitoxin ParD1/3/4
MDDALTALPEPIRQYIHDQVATGAYDSPADFICQLVRDAQRRKSKDAIKARVLDNLQDELTEMTPQDWSEIRQL